MKKYVKSTAALLGATIALAGCSGPIATHDDAMQSIQTDARTDTRVAEGWSAAESGGLVDNGWILCFNDPQLVTLVDEAEKNNFGLKISGARLQQAEALARQAGAALKPSVGLSGLTPTETVRPWANSMAAT